MDLAIKRTPCFRDVDGVLHRALGVRLPVPSADGVEVDFVFAETIES